MTTIRGRQRQVTMEMSKTSNKIDLWTPTAPLWQISKRRYSTIKLNSHLLMRMKMKNMLMISNVKDRFSRVTWRSICLIKWTKSTTIYSTSKCWQLITQEIAMCQVMTIATYPQVMVLMGMAPNSYLCRLKRCSNQSKRHRLKSSSKYESRLRQTRHKLPVYNNRSSNFSNYWWTSRKVYENS